MNDETVERLEENDKALRLYKQQLDALKEDLEVMIAFSGPDIVNMARQKAEAGQVMSNLANPGGMDSDKVFREKCRRFAERYNRLSRG
jgi:hypothetical protein